MDFQAEAVSGAVHECVPQPTGREHLTGRRIDQARLHTGPNHGNRRAWAARTAANVLENASVAGGS